MKKTALLLMIVLLALTLTGCGQETVYTRELFAMGTYINLRIWNVDDGDSLLDTAARMIGEYDALFSTTSHTSDIKRLNDSGGEPMDLDERTDELLHLALSYAEKTGHKLNPATGALTSLWGFSSAAGPSVPEETALQAALETVDLENLKEENGLWTLMGGTQLDLGAVAKGFVAEKVRAFLKDSGVQKGILDFGGNLLTIGQKSEKENWLIGITDPRNPSEVLLTLEVGEIAAVTSGDYQRYFEAEGKRFHHILDPMTGWPGDTGFISVTVLTADSGKADCLSTGCFLMEVEEAMELLQAEGAEGIFVDHDRQIFVTPGLQNRIQIKNSDYSLINS